MIVSHKFGKLQNKCEFKWRRSGENLISCVTVSYLPCADPESQSLSDLRFVAVRRSAVDVSVPTVQGSQNCPLDLKNTQLPSISSHQKEPRGEERRWYLAWRALPGAQANRGHPLARREGHIGAHGPAPRI